MFFRLSNLFFQLIKPVFSLIKPVFSLIKPVFSLIKPVFSPIYTRITNKTNTSNNTKIVLQEKTAFRVADATKQGWREQRTKGGKEKKTKTPKN
jgi:phage-related protein